MKRNKMTNPEMFRVNNFNRCRHCGQFFEQDEIYYFKVMNGNELEYKLQSDCVYDIENFYIHKKCFDENYKKFDEKKFLIELFNTRYKRAANKFTQKQNELIKMVKENCYRNNYSFKEKTKYIHISGVHYFKNSKIQIKGKYNKYEMKMEEEEKKFNFLFLAQKVYLDDLMRKK